MTDDTSVVHEHENARICDKVECQTCEDPAAFWCSVIGFRCVPCFQRDDESWQSIQRAKGSQQ